MVGARRQMQEVPAPERMIKILSFWIIGALSPCPPFGGGYNLSFLCYDS